MVATVATTLPTGDDWSYEVKWDGYRALLMKDGARVRLISRNLKDLTRDFPTLVAAAATLESNALIRTPPTILEQSSIPLIRAIGSGRRLRTQS